MAQPHQALLRPQGGPVLEGVYNTRLQQLAEEHFFHIEDKNFNSGTDLKALLGDVKVVLMAGPAARAESMAKQLSEAFHLPITQHGSSERYAIYKVGPVISLSHGIGGASLSIVLHEITKVLHYSGATDVTYMRIGTSGGVGVTPGTIVISQAGLNAACENQLHTMVLGKRKSYCTDFDEDTIGELQSAAKRAKIACSVGKTLSTDGYYEEQGRLDGAVAIQYTETDKLEWLQKLHETGVLAVEMEGNQLAGFCNRTRIRSGMVCAALLNRLKGDQTPDQASPAQMAKWTNDAVLLVIEWIRGKLGAEMTNGKKSEMTNGKKSVAANQITNCDQFVEVDAIPIIDLKSWYDGTPEGRQKVVEAMREACENVGFFFIRNHGVQQSVVQDVFDVSRRYFDLPVAEKKKIAMGKDYPYGYENQERLVRSETDPSSANGAKEKTQPADSKESFNVAIGPESKSHHEMPAPRWPENPPDFKDKCTAHYRACEKVVNEMLKIAALALDLPENFFEDKTDKHVAALRSLNYPDCSGCPPLPGQLRASPHTDYGTFTLLCAGANREGLQVMRKGGDWLDVDIPEDCFTVNVGDLLCRWTNDKWRSTRHRVVVKTEAPAKRRQSLAYFHNLNPDAMVRTLPSCVSADCPDKYNDVRANDYLMMKHFSAMGYTKK